MAEPALSLCFNLESLLLKRVHVFLDSLSEDRLEELSRDDLLSSNLEIELIDVYSKFIQDIDTKDYKQLKQTFNETFKRIQIKMGMSYFKVMLR